MTRTLTTLLLLLLTPACAADDFLIITASEGCPGHTDDTGDAVTTDEPTGGATDGAGECVDEDCDGPVSKAALAGIQPGPPAAPTTPRRLARAPAQERR